MVTLDQDAQSASSFRAANRGAPQILIVTAPDAGGLNLANTALDRTSSSSCLRGRLGAYVANRTNSEMRLRPMGAEIVGGIIGKPEGIRAATARGLSQVAKTPRYTH